MNLKAWFERSAEARRAAGLRFWVEALLVGSVYFAYSMVRNLFGSAAVTPEVAANNADAIIDIEKAMGLYIEADVQAVFIDWTAFIQFWNLFYGVAHFLVTYVVLIWLYLAHPTSYRHWRRTGLIATTSALVGFAAFPLMPPRLLERCGDYGACRPGDEFVDTVIEVGGIWSFEGAGFDAITNQYAAMPSLHIGWALWCTLILIPRVSSLSAKALAVIYPFLTLFAIVVTANHYWIDGVGGVAVILLGIWLSRWWERFAEQKGLVRKRGPVESASDDLGSTVVGGVA